MDLRPASIASVDVALDERCIEPRCDRERAPDGLRCVLHASRLGQTTSVPIGLSLAEKVDVAPPPVAEPPPRAEITRPIPSPTGSGRTLTALGYGAIAAGWIGIGLLFFDSIAAGAILSVGGHATALGLALAAAMRRPKPPAGT